MLYRTDTSYYYYYYKEKNEGVNNLVTVRTSYGRIKLCTARYFRTKWSVDFDLTRSVRKRRVGASKAKIGVRKGVYTVVFKTA